jgi:hypothetical protein
MKNIFPFLFLILFLSRSTAIAADDRGYTLLIKNYLSALKNDNPREVVLTWEEIHANPKAKSYMEQNYPRAAYAYHLTEMAFQLSQYLEDYRKNYPGSNLPPETVLTTPEAVPLLTNRDDTLLYPNQDRRSNEQTVLQRINSPFFDNQTRALSHPNQNERPNQELIENRLGRISITGQ